MAAWGTISLFEQHRSIYSNRTVSWIRPTDCSNRVYRSCFAKCSRYLEKVFFWHGTSQLYHMYSYDIIVINTRTRLRLDIILVPWYNYNVYYCYFYYIFSTTNAAIILCMGRSKQSSILYCLFTAHLYCMSHTDQL